MSKIPHALEFSLLLVDVDFVPLHACNLSDQCLVWENGTIDLFFMCRSIYWLFVNCLKQTCTSSINLIGNLEEKSTLQCQDYRFVPQMHCLLSYYTISGCWLGSRLVQSITIQCLEALKFLHSLGLIHCDLKPENILVKSYSRCEVKVIDLGSSCFETDHLCSYVQSRSYRAPEVIMGLPYGKKIDIWSLGCILAELCTGNVSSRCSQFCSWQILLCTSCTLHLKCIFKWY